MKTVLVLCLLGLAVMGVLIVQNIGKPSRGDYHYVPNVADIFRR
jgi:hypothetical protein